MATDQPCGCRIEPVRRLCSYHDDGAHPADFEAEHAPCCQCGATQGVCYVSPDMDIEPVPLCLACRFNLFDRANENDGSVPPP